MGVNYFQTTMAPKFIKETLLHLKSHIDPHILIVGDFITPLSSIDSHLDKKLNIEG